jgi:hypothetical protein
MPRLKPLTEAQQREETNKKADEAFRDVLALYKSRNCKTDEQVASRLGWHRLKISRMKKDPGTATFEQVRAIMHSLGASSEDWLRLGGF